MTIYSQNPEKRLFTYSTSFQHGNEIYTESYYFTIKDIVYDKQELKTVKVDIIVNVKGFLDNEAYHKLESIFISPFPDDIKKSVKEYEILKRMNRG